MHAEHREMPIVSGGHHLDTAAHVALGLHPLVRMLIGLVVGFGGAAATIAGIDWLDAAGADGSDRTIDQVDLRRSCEQRGLQLHEVGDGSDRWRCAGTVGGVWTIHPISPDDVCLERFGGIAVEAVTDDVWHCATAS